MSCVTLCQCLSRSSLTTDGYVLCHVVSGFEPIVIENELDGDELRTSIDDVQRAMVAKGAENILCVLSTTR